MNAKPSIDTTLEPLQPLDRLSEALRRLESSITDDVKAAVNVIVAPLEKRIVDLEAVARSSPTTGAAVPKAASVGEPFAKRPSKPKTAVKLPSRLTLRSLVRFLEEQECELQNNRESGGALWMKYSVRAKQVAQALEERGISVKEKTDRKKQPGRWFLLDEYGAID